METGISELRVALPRRIIEEYDTSGRSVGTGWATARTWSNHEFSGGSKLLIAFHIPTRNDSQSWGGLYTELQVSFNNAVSWASLGHSGYDGGVMMSGAASIATYANSFLYDPKKATDFSCRFRFRHRSYNGTTHINKNHSLDNRHKLWHTHLRIEEIYQ